MLRAEVYARALRASQKREREPEPFKSLKARRRCDRGTGKSITLTSTFHEALSLVNRQPWRINVKANLRPKIETWRRKTTKASLSLSQSPRIPQQPRSYRQFDKKEKSQQLRHYNAISTRGLFSEASPSILFILSECKAIIGVTMSFHHRPI